MVHMPGFLLGHFQPLATQPTLPSLLFPEPFDPALSGERLPQLPAETLLQIQFPRRVVRVRLSPDLHMADNPYPGRRHQFHRPGFSPPITDAAREDPLVMAYRPEVSLPEPLPTLLRVSSLTPAPHDLEDAVIHISEGAFAGSKTVVHGPAFDWLIQAPNQFPGRLAACLIDRFLDLGQKRLDTSRGRFQERWSAAIAADRLTQEVEAVLEPRDVGFLVGEFETPFLQEVRHERFDLLFKENLGSARNYKVIRVSNQMDAMLPGLRPGLAEVFRQDLLQSIQSPIRQDGGNDPALRSAFRGGEEDLLLQVTCFQPASENFLVHWDMSEQPGVVDPIKASFDVSLQNPAGTVRFAQDIVTLCQGIRTVPFPPKAIRVVIGQGFRDGIEAQQVKCLHSSIRHRGDS